MDNKCILFIKVLDDSSSKEIISGGEILIPKKNSSVQLEHINSSLSNKNKNEKISKKVEFDKKTEQFNLNYNDLISSLTENKSKTPISSTNNGKNSKYVSSFNFKKHGTNMTLGKNEKSPEKYDFSRSMKIKKTKDNKLDLINILVTKCEKKLDVNSDGNTTNNVTKTISDLTNTEDIKDFYAYTKECLRRFNKIIQPTKDELEKLYINSFPFDDELKNKKLAVFDLDETLVHCLTKNIEKAQVKLLISSFNSTIGINIRPFVKQALHEIMNNYVIIVYTASHQTYADEVLNYLDPKKEIFAYRLYRHNCVRVKMENDDIYVKDLRIFKNIDLKKIIIIDNSALSFAFQLDNGIPILPYYDNKDDHELMTLVNYLNSIATVDDLREENRKFLKMNYFLKKACNELSDESEILDESVIENDSSYNSENNQNGLLILNPCKNESPNTSIEHNYNSNDSDVKRHKSKNFQEQLFQILEEFSHHFNRGK